MITATGAPGSGGSGGAAAGSTTAAPAEAASPAVPTLSADQAAGVARRSPAWPARPARSPGLDGADGLASDHGIGSNDWVVGPSAVGDRRRAAGQRPAPRASRCRRSGSSTACTARRSMRACPYDVAGVSFPGVPGGRPRPQRADRVGRDERRPRRPGPRHRDRRPGRSDALPRPGRRLAAVHDPRPRRSGQRRRAGRRSRSARPATARSSTTSTSGSPDAPPMALRWTGIHPRPARTARSRRSSRLNVAADFDDVPGDALALRRAVPELRLRRRRRPHRLPAPGPRADPLRSGRPRACARSAATTAAASGPATSRSTSCPGSSTRPTA